MRKLTSTQNLFHKLSTKLLTSYKKQQPKYLGMSLIVGNTKVGTGFSKDCWGSFSIFFLDKLSSKKTCLKTSKFFLVISKLVFYD